MGEAVDTIPSILNKCLFVSQDRQTDGRTYLRLYSSWMFYMLKKYQIIQQVHVPNNTLYFYGLNRIFNVCSFP